SATVGPNRLRSPLTSIVVSMSWLYGSAANTARTAAVISLLGATGHPGGGWWPGIAAWEAMTRMSRTLPRRLLPRRTVRLRLTALYGVMFVCSGAVLLAIASGVAVSRSSVQAVPAPPLGAPPNPLARALARVQELQTELNSAGPAGADVSHNLFVG